MKVIPRGRTHTNSKGAMLCHSSPRFSEKEVKTVRANRTKTNSYEMIPIWICFLQCVRSDSAVFFLHGIESDSAVAIVCIGSDRTCASIRVEEYLECSDG